MSGRQQQTLVLSSLRGRDGGTESDFAVPMHKARVCENIELYRASYAVKRNGAVQCTELMTASGLTNVPASMHRHVPGADTSLQELWIVDSGYILARLVPVPVTDPVTPPAWTTMTWASTPVAPFNATSVNWVSFNGKLFILADSAVDRVQVFDPTHSPNLLRLAGLNAPLAPVVADTGTAGTYPATPRWYRVTFVQQVFVGSGGVAVRRSNASPAATWTPSGSKTGVVVTRPAINGNGETHWELWGSQDAEGPFYFLQLLPIATTTATDTELPADYYQHVTVMPLQGENTPLHSAKYGLTDDNRLLLAGAWEPGHSQDEVWFTPVLGSTSPLFADDERLPSTNKIAFNERDGGHITALGGPLQSSVIVFKDRQTWRLMPTGDVDDPYRRRLISRTVGCIHQKTVVVAEDDAGVPTIYWLSEEGPYRFNLATGLARLTWDIEDLWANVNLRASIIPAHGVFYPDKYQIWWWVAQGTEPGDVPQFALKLVYDTRVGRIIESGQVRDGWVTHTGESARARCSVMYGENANTGSPGAKLVPYIGQNSGFKLLWECDRGVGYDHVTAFRAQVQQPFRHLAGLENVCTLGHTGVLLDGYGLIGPGEGIVAVTQQRNYDTTIERVSLLPVPLSEGPTALRVAEGVETADATSVAIHVGDPAIVKATMWRIDAILQPFEVRERVIL